VAAGVDLVHSKLWWTRIEKFPRTPKIAQDVAVESRHDLKGGSTGFVAGLLWKLHPAVQVGMSYQSGAAVDLSGRNIFIVPSLALGSTTVPGPYGPSIRLAEVPTKFYPSQDVTGRLTMPAQITFGIMIVPVSRLSLLLDAQQTRWREFGAWEFRSKNEGGDLSPAFNQDFRSFYSISPDYGIQSGGLKLSDTWDIKAGLEFRPGSHLALRSGFAGRRGSAAPGYLNPLDPNLDQNIVSLGFGYEGPLFSVYDNRQVSELSFDVYLRYGFSKEKASTLPGHEFTYKAHSWAGGVGVGFNF
jgi:long-subunit fatty acid transport protein